MSTRETELVITSHIEITPGVRSGKPRVTGTRITVSDIVLWTEQGMSPDEVVTQFPSLTLADVYAALAYYHDNRQVIDDQIKESRRFAEQLKSQLATSNVSPGTPADGDPVSS